MTIPFVLPPPDSFVELPGMRGLRIAQVGQADGKTLEVIEAVKDVVIPAMTHPSGEKGRVLSGRIRFSREGSWKVLQEGDTWEVGAEQPQGPHIVLSDHVRVAILRDGKSAFDLN